MLHKHRIKPGHMGGEYIEGNIISVAVTQCDKQTANHAMWHFANYQLWGKEEDRLAWKGLAGFLGKEEVIFEMMEEGRRRGRETMRMLHEDPEYLREKARKVHEQISRLDEESPGWREEHGEKIKESGGPDRSVETRKEKKLTMWDPEWQREMGGRGGKSNKENETGFCNLEVVNCPVRKARGGRAGCLSRQGVKIDGVLFFPESFGYRTHLSSDFVSNYVHFGFQLPVR